MRSAASAYAWRLLTALSAAGIHDVVVCPGSRSQALALAAAALHRSGRVRVHVRLDERGAGFLALGIARETGLPAAVVVTSGTAVANLHPAVLEAHHSDVPLLVVTADRPPELHGIRANQTTAQVGIFGDAVRAAFSVIADDDATPEADARAAVAAAMGGAALEGGPVQLDVAFRDPLSSAEAVDGHADADADGAGAGAVDAAKPIYDIAPAPHTVVIAGADAGEGAEALARGLGAPLVAEPSSGARFGPNLVLPGVLGTDLVGEVRRVVVVGHPTLSRAVTALLRERSIEVVVQGRRGLDNVRGTVLPGAVRAVGEPGEWARAWVGRWVQASRALAAQQTEATGSVEGLSARDYAAAALADARRPVTRRDLVDAVWRHTWPHDRLVLGASRLIRELDASVPGKRIVVHSNRGLAGIDGTIATATGVAIAHDSAGGGGITRALIGDLTLLHDVGSLLMPTDEPRPRLQIVVGNDGGGSIFDLLEVAATADPADFARVQRTPHEVRIADLAAAYGIPYVAVADRAGLERALTGGAPAIIDVALVD